MNDRETGMKTGYLLIATTAALIVAAGANAAETISYAFDTQGRVTRVTSTGTGSGTTSTCYYYDKASNRVRELVVRSATCP